jgi:septal ring factor EnvC (AmiA/AmiB activator)
MKKFVILLAISAAVSPATAGINCAIVDTTATPPVLTMKLLVVALLLMISTSAFAQQPDPAFLQRVLTSLQSQRNQAMDNLAASEAKSAMATEQLDATRGQVSKLTFENTKLKAENEALKKAQDKTKDGKPK